MSFKICIQYVRQHTRKQEGEFVMESEDDGADTITVIRFTEEPRRQTQRLPADGQAEVGKLAAGARRPPACAARLVFQHRLQHRVRMSLERLRQRTYGEERLYASTRRFRQDDVLRTGEIHLQVSANGAVPEPEAGEG